MTRRDLLPPAGATIALACCASRPSFNSVTAQLLRRLRAQGLLQRYRIELIVVHDSVARLNVEELAAATDLQSLRLIEEDTASYATRRNRALETALTGEARYLLFFDDDEHWVRPAPPTSDTRGWRDSDPLIPHLAAQCAGAVVTCGTILGQISPIPACLPDHTDPPLLRELGHALRLGSEFLHRRSFVEDAGRWRWQPSCRLDAPMQIRRGILPLSGGNVTLDLQAIHDGRIPPYWNPPDARGEDALLGARIRGLPVRRVSACSFHDPFQRVHCTDEGEPFRISPPSDEPRRDLQRFASALCGWVGYAPMLVQLGGGARAGLDPDRRLDTIQRVLDDVSVTLAADLDCPRLTTLPALLASRRLACAGDLVRLRSESVDWWRRWARKRP